MCQRFQFNNGANINLNYAVSVQSRLVACNIENSTKRLFLEADKLSERVEARDVSENAEDIFWRR